MKGRRLDSCVNCVTIDNQGHSQVLGCCQDQLTQTLIVRLVTYLLALLQKLVPLAPPFQPPGLNSTSFVFFLRRMDLSLTFLFQVPAAHDLHPYYERSIIQRDVVVKLP